MKTLFCDWNGTILDDMPIWEQAMRKTFLAFGKNPPTIAEYFCELETGDYLEVYKKRGVIASRDELNAIYEPTYEVRLKDANLFPGAKEVLRQLSERGVLLMLVTAQPEALVTPLLEKFAVSPLFQYCAFHARDKKAVIAKIIQDQGLNQKECYFIGDSPSDIRHAKKAGIISIAFLGDYISEDLLRNVKAEHYIRSFQEISALIIS